MKGHVPSEGQTQDSLLGRLRPVPVLTATFLDRPKGCGGRGRCMAGGERLGNGIYSAVSLGGMGTGPPGCVWFSEVADEGQNTVLTVLY